MNELAILLFIAISARFCIDKGLLLAPGVRDLSIEAAEGIAVQESAHRGQSENDNDVHQGPKD